MVTTWMTHVLLDVVWLGVHIIEGPLELVDVFPQLHVLVILVLVLGTTGAELKSRHCNKTVHQTGSVFVIYSNLSPTIFLVGNLGGAASLFLLKTPPRNVDSFFLLSSFSGGFLILSSFFAGFSDQSSSSESSSNLVTSLFLLAPDQINICQNKTQYKC